MTTSFEEAKTCPKCKIPGEDRSTQPVPSGNGIRPGTTVHLIYCLNDRCNWYNTPWSVQVNPDGTIPPPQDHRRDQKKYPTAVPDEVATRLVDNLGRQLEAETQKGAEIRGPGSR